MELVGVPKSNSGRSWLRAPGDEADADNRRQQRYDCQFDSRIHDLYCDVARSYWSSAVVVKERARLDSYFHALI